MGKSFFQNSLNRAGISQQIKATQQLEIVRQVLQERFGEGAHVHVYPSYIKNRAVTLTIKHPAVGEEIRRQEEALLSEVNRRIGRPELLRIYFKIYREE